MLFIISQANSLHRQRSACYRQIQFAIHLMLPTFQTKDNKILEIARRASCN